MKQARIYIAGETEGQWIPMEETPYQQEIVLQAALAEFPDLLPGDQINPEDPPRWLLVKREMDVPAEEGGGSVGSLDHLYLDHRGKPTFVECKRAVDTRSRREVVAQMLDYAANGTEYWPMEKLRQAATETAAAQGRNLDDQILELIGDDTADVEAYWADVEENLREGSIRLIFVADSIPKPLRRLVEFLNEKMSDVEVLAVEVKQYLGHGHRAMVPRVIGVTEMTRKSKTINQKRQWDETSFFADLEGKAEPAEVQVARQILDWSRRMADNISWGEGIRTGSFVPQLVHNGATHPLFAVWSRSGFEFYFQHYQTRKPFDAIEKRVELLRRLNRIQNVGLSETDIDRRPAVPLSAFIDPEALSHLLATFEWMIGEIRAA